MHIAQLQELGRTLADRERGNGRGGGGGRAEEVKKDVQGTTEGRGGGEGGGGGGVPAEEVNMDLQGTTTSSAPLGMPLQFRPANKTESALSMSA